MPVSVSSEKTSTCTSSDVVKTHVTRDFRMIRSPTLIECRNCRSSTAAVTRRLRVWRWQAMAPAMSMRCITVPPRMNPSGFASFGRTTCTISVADSEARLGVRFTNGSYATKTRKHETKNNVRELRFLRGRHRERYLTTRGLLAGQVHPCLHAEHVCARGHVGQWYSRPVSEDSPRTGELGGRVLRLALVGDGA